MRICPGESVPLVERISRVLIVTEKGPNVKGPVLQD